MSPFQANYTADENAEAVSAIGVPNIDRPVSIYNTILSATSLDTGIIDVSQYRSVAFITWCDKSAAPTVFKYSDVTITHYIDATPVYRESYRMATTDYVSSGNTINLDHVTKGRLWCRGNGIRFQFDGTVGDTDRQGITVFASYTETGREDIIVGHGWQNASAGHGLQIIGDSQWVWDVNSGSAIAAGPTTYREYPSGFRAGLAQVMLMCPSATAGNTLDFIVGTDGTISRAIAGDNTIAYSSSDIMRFEVILPRNPIMLYIKTVQALGAGSLRVLMTQGPEGR